MAPMFKSTTSCGVVVMAHAQNHCSPPLNKRADFLLSTPKVTYPATA